MVVSAAPVEQWLKELDKHSPQSVLELALREFGDDLAISFSGAEDVVLVDMASRIQPGVRMFSLDTGRLHAETYELLEAIRDRYDVKFEVAFPDPTAVEELVREKGLYSFRRDGHKECCGIRKVEPLQRQLSRLNAWVTGQRRDQSPSTRAEIAVVEMDKAFGGPDHPLVKFNPLANWTSADVWAYIREHDVPFNKLHERGFVSIGCEPCTRPVLPNEHERAGRWWWEEATLKECGLHAGNLDRG